MTADDSVPALRQIGSTVTFETPWLTITHDDVVRPDGTTTQFGVVRTPDFALVIPFDGECYTLVEQFRYPVGRRLWEFPQGALRDRPDAEPEEIARTELAEETGLRAGNLQHLGYLHEAYGRATTGFHVFLATDLTQGMPSREIDESDMRMDTFTMDDIWSMIDEGLITDASTVSALALLDRWRRIS